MTMEHPQSLYWFDNVTVLHTILSYTVVFIAFTSFKCFTKPHQRGGKDILFSRTAEELENFSVIRNSTSTVFKQLKLVLLILSTICCRVNIGRVNVFYQLCSNHWVQCWVG